MSGQSYPHETIAWAKQRLDELDAIIGEVEKSSDELEGKVRVEAEQSLAKLKESRLTISRQYDRLLAEADDLKQGAKELQDALDDEWIAVETSLQSFLSAAADEAGTVRRFVVARADAQRQSWEASLQAFRDQATETVEKARQELDAAIRRLSDEADKFQAKIGEAKDAGDESWTAVKAGLAEAKEVHDRTVEKIKGAFAKLF